MESRCNVVPMMDVFDDYVRSKGINICAMIMLVGIFYHWLYVFSVIISNSDFLQNWWMIIAWVVFSWIFPTIVFPLLTFGNNLPQNEKNIGKIILSVIVSLAFVVESIMATINQLSINEANDNITDIAYYFHYSSMILYIGCTIFGLILIGLYCHILIFWTNDKSYHSKKSDDLTQLNENDKVRFEDKNDENKSQRSDMRKQDSTVAMKKEMESEVKEAKGNVDHLAEYLWPRSSFTAKRLMKQIPIPSRVYQVLFVALIGMVFDIEVSLYARDQILESLSELQDNIDYLNTAVDTYNDIKNYNATRLDNAIDRLSSLPALSSYSSEFSLFSGAYDLISQAQRDADSVIDSINYAIELLESMYSFGSALSDGIIVGIVLASITGLWAIFIVRNAFYKKYVNLRHNSPDFRYKEKNYQLFWTTRFVGTVSSYLIVGPLLTIWFIALLVAVLGWSSFQQFIEAYWYYFFYAPLLYLFEAFIIRALISTKIAKYSKFDEKDYGLNINGTNSKILHINRVSFWLWYVMFNDILFFPVSFLMAIARYIFLQLVVLASYIRPDITIFPRNMESWDHGHTTFVSTVQAMIQREMIFISGINQQAAPSAPNETETEINSIQNSIKMNQETQPQTNQ